MLRELPAVRRRDPDEDLLQVVRTQALQYGLAVAGRARVSETVAEALVDNFAGQWLYLRNLDQPLAKDFEAFPDFDEALQASMKKTPLVMFYPGRYDGFSLRLFNTLADDHYYRAFRLVD